MHNLLNAHARVVSVIQIASVGACSFRFTALQHDGCAGNIKDIYLFGAIGLDRAVFQLVVSIGGCFQVMQVECRLW